MKKPPQSNAKPSRRVSGKPKNKRAEQNKPIAESIDKFLSNHMNIILWVFMAIALLFSLLLFDTKVSLSGDDSFYIIRAAEFARSFEFPLFQGPLYPMLLSIIILVTGINLVLLKGLSILFILAFVYFTHKAFTNRIPPILHVTVLLLVTVNSYILYFASQTYSEALYMFLQAVVILVFFRFFVDQSQKRPNLRTEITRHFVLATVLMTLVLTRNVGFSAVIAVVAYFILSGQWRNLVFSLISFVVLFMVFQGIKHLVWGIDQFQFSNQGAGLMQKDFYNAARGKEDLAGFIIRFWGNSNLYLSRHFYTMAGLRTPAPVQIILPVLTIVFYIVFLSGFVFSYLKNRYIFFTGLISGIFLLITFFSLQTNWDQNRLIIPAYSLMLLLFFTATYYLAQWKVLRMVYLLIPAFGLFMFSQIFILTFDNSKLAIKNSGKYDGLTPDWKHYMQASEWASKNLAKTDVIACRKSSISFIYGNGREFYSIMNVPAFSTDDFFKNWKKENRPYKAFLREDLSKTRMKVDVVNNIIKCCVAQLALLNKVYIIYQFPDSLNKSIMDEINSVKLKSISNADSLKVIADSGNNKSMIIYPDSLLITIMKNKVTHVITANLRRNPNSKDGQIINTVERYMAFINDKYPNFMTLVQKIGDDDDEPAMIYKLNYEEQKKMLLKKK